MKTEPKEFQELIKCWRAMPKVGGYAPLKTTFKPSRLRRIMPNLFMLERSSKREICVRLMGSELETSFDRDAPKGNVFDTLLAKDWRFYDRFMQACSNAPCGGRFARRVRTADGLIIEVESLGVPLADDDGVPRFILGVVVMRPSFGPAMKRIKRPQRYFAGLDHEFIDLGNGTPGTIEAYSEGKLN